MEIFLINSNKNNKNNKNNKTRTLTTIAVMTAAAFILQLLGTVLPFKVGGFLEIEFSDLPAIIGTLSLGPAAGVVIELLKNILKCGATTTGFVGELANFVINGTFVLVIGLVYKYNKTRKGAILALLAGTLTIALSGILANILILLPLYMPSADLSSRFTLALTVITPFNLVKGIVLSVITFYIYKPLSRIIHNR